MEKYGHIGAAEAYFDAGEMTTDEMDVCIDNMMSGKSTATVEEARVNNETGLYHGPLWQESFYQKPLHEFSKREVFQVVSNEMAREYPRPTEFNRALNELGRFGVIVSVNTLDENACL